MSKVHIVQIAKASDADGNIDTEYLDNYGRVWYDGGHLEKYDVTATSHKSRWVTEWKQLEMPDDPDEHTDTL